MLTHSCRALDVTARGHQQRASIDAGSREAAGDVAEPAVSIARSDELQQVASTADRLALLPGLELDVEVKARRPSPPPAATAADRKGRLRTDRPRSRTLDQRPFRAHALLGRTMGGCSKSRRTRERRDADRVLEGESHDRSLQGCRQRRRPRLDAGLGAVRAATGARRGAERRVHRARRRGLLGDELLRRADRHAEHRQDRRRRGAVSAVAHDGVVLTDPVVSVDRSQSHAQQHGVHHRGGDRVPERQRHDPAGERHAPRDPR